MKQSLVIEILNSCNVELVQEYVELLINRVTHSSMNLEKDLGNIDDSKNAIRLRDNMKAFKYLLSNLWLNSTITEEMIVTAGDIVNDSSPYVSRGYRKLGEKLAGTDISISKAESIETDMNLLLTKYHQKIVTSKAEALKREAAFHIDFIRIHPFEDGNGRTGRLLLNYNLLKEGIAPVIITDDLIEYYQSYIKNNDVEGMANLFSIQSKKEETVLQTFIQTTKLNEKRTEMENTPKSHK